MSYAEVAVNSPIAQRQTFSYTIPPEMLLTIGQAVWVPFGAKVLQGVVLGLSDYPAVEETREIAGVIDPRPMLSPIQVKLAYWISEHYLASLFDAAALMLPPGFERRLLTFFYPSPDASEIALASLTLEQSKALNFLRKKGKIAQKDIEKGWGKRRARQILTQLCRKGLVVEVQELEGVKVRPKSTYEASLAIDVEQAKQEAKHLLPRAPKQAALLKLLADKLEPIPVSQATRYAQCSLAAAWTLEKKGLISIERVRVPRDPLLAHTFSPSTPPIPTPSQEEALRRIQACFGQNGTSSFLLHGITGSGKTEVYLRALEFAIALGKRGIALVPEIALTPQTICCFASRFPRQVAVFHSKLSLGEQFDQWQGIRDGDFKVVVGSRGAIFAPQPDLGLIVIDEEHEWTYKQQDQSPRYQAREVALKLGELSGAVVILGSATPDVESFYRAQTGKLELLPLPQRVTQEGHLPEIEVVDLRQELKAGNRSIFSRSLSRAIEKTLAAGEQTILFLNRRGAATSVQCRNCGFVIKCRRCDLPLTYHAVGEELVCHQCNWRRKVPMVCPECSSLQIRFLGVGTQKVEQEVARLFSQARLMRWDRDTTSGKHSHEEILSKFLNHEADILIGTQMIAKGLDLPLVTLVGVISADTSLYLPDLRAGERTFQLLSQVVGRAGRGQWPGKVIIQTYTPEHYAISAAAKHDYAALYQREINYRREYDNPPFGRLACLRYAHPNATQCQREAERVLHQLEQEIDRRGMPNTALIGPSPVFISKVRGKFRWQIIVRGADPACLLAKLPLPSGWTVDIDPISLL